LTKEEIDTVDKRRNYAVSVVGSGQEAIFWGLAFAMAGFKVVCADADQSVAKRLSKGNIGMGYKEAEAKLKSYLKTEQLIVTSDLKAAVSKSDIILIVSGARIDEKRCIDRAEAESVCKQVGAALQKGNLVVYCSAAGFGFVEDVVKGLLENTSGLKAGEDFGLACCTQQRTGECVELLIGALDKCSLSSSTLFFESLAKSKVISVPNTRIVELATFFAAAKRDADAAMTKEFAVLCEKAGVDFEEIRKLLESISFEQIPKPSISELEYYLETYLLLDAGESLNLKLRLPLLTRQMNEEFVKHAVGLTQEALRDVGKTLRRSRVAVLGFGKTGTSAGSYIKQLLSKGAKVSQFGASGSGSTEVATESSVKRTLNEAVEASDCVVLLFDDEQLNRLNLKKLHAIMKSPAALVDLSGIVEPSKVQDAGFAYRGLGRGVWKE
jgi:UDP-N-acetyl-D-mannosaminuronic acid dehydrogenase